MLMKAITSSADFDQTLRVRRLIAFGLLTVGLVGIVCYFLFVGNSTTLPDFARGFYLGAASGITVAAVFLLIRVTVLLANPEAKRKAKIKETDEREKQIVNDSFRIAGLVTFFVTAAALFAVLPFSFPAFFALLGVMALYTAVCFGTNFILQKRG